MAAESVVVWSEDGLRGEGEADNNKILYLWIPVLLETAICKPILPAWSPSLPLSLSPSLLGQCWNSVYGGKLRDHYSRGTCVPFLRAGTIAEIEVAN